MKSTWPKAIAELLRHEGGNDDDPRDPGGRTSRGILQIEWSHWRETHPGLPSDVWQAPQDQVVAIYRQKYWDGMRCDELPAGVDYAVFDFGVNSGNSRSVKLLQKLVGAAVDGEVGDETLRRALAVDSKKLVASICDERLTFLRGLSTWGTFGRGWSTRVSDVRALALTMATDAPTKPPAKPGLFAAFMSWLGGLIKRDAPAPVIVSKGAPWVDIVRKDTGIKETRDGATILSWRGMIAKAFEDMLSYVFLYTSPTGQPWCGFGLGAAMARCGIRPPFGKTDTDKFMWADSWARNWGQKLNGPIPGSIGVRTRNGGGHVTMVEKVQGNRIWCRGYNQRDSVNVSEYALDNQWTGFYWPPGYSIVSVTPNITNAVEAGSES